MLEGGAGYQKNPRTGSVALLRPPPPFFLFSFIKKAVQCLERADIHPIPSLALWVGEFSRLGKICANAKEFYKEIYVSVQLIQFLIPS